VVLYFIYRICTDAFISSDYIASTNIMILNNSWK
jgi:hypothetical protein